MGFSLWLPCAEGKTNLPQPQSGSDVETDDESDDVTDAPKRYKNIYCSMRLSRGREGKHPIWFECGFYYA